MNKNQVQIIGLCLVLLILTVGLYIISRPEPEIQYELKTNTTESADTENVEENNEVIDSENNENVETENSETVENQ